jgi:uncharacterized protein with GYD domain
MAIFITQGRYTQQAIKGMIANPEDRSEAVAGLLAAVGGKLLGYYLTFGESDFVIIGEMPGPAEEMAVLMTAASGGGVTDMRTMLAVTTAEAKAVMEKAAAVGASYRAPGAAA